MVFGFSNPNLDPCGYRSLMVMQLAELYYNDSKIFDDLVLNNTAITISEDADGTFLMTVPEDPKPNTEKVNIRPKSVELVALVEEVGLTTHSSTEALPFSTIWRSWTCLSK